jgi:hypothetical protein
MSQPLTRLWELLRDLFDLPISRTAAWRAIGREVETESRVSEQMGKVTS